MLLTDARVVTPDGVLDPGWVVVEGDRITGVGGGLADAPGTDERVELGGRHLVPGFVDLHVHGGGGHSMQSADAAQTRAGVAFHRSRGTTSLLVSVMSAPLDEMLATLQAVSELAGEDGMLGAHLEGPFLNPRRAGAHDPRDLLAPDVATFDRLRAASGDRVRVVTMAPELPGGLELLRHVSASGAVAAIGHSDVDHDAAMAAFDAGATHVTHLFNGMRPWHHREPGLAGAALAHPSVTCELINDGVHVHGAVARMAFAAAPGRIALVTDATEAAGSSDMAPRLADGVTLAGSALTMERALRRAVVDLGLPIATAVLAASTVPARVLGLDEKVGSIRSGLAADLVVLDRAFGVEAVMAAGRWITSGRLFHT
jgi:N-acetylglucosamine-6-phosphate deacetylase